MTTGRINQVTARAISPLQLGKGAHASRPNIFSLDDRILRQKAGHRSSKARPPGRAMASPSAIHPNQSAHESRPQIVSHSMIGFFDRKLGIGQSKARPPGRAMARPFRASSIRHALSTYRLGMWHHHE